MTRKVNGKAIQREMDLRGWTQTDLAERAGISQPTVSALLNGGSPATGTLAAIARAFTQNPPVVPAEFLEDAS